MQTDFWPTAWALETELSKKPKETAAQEAIDILKEQIALQSFIFFRRNWSDPDWFPVLEQHGLFSDPPAVVRDPNGIRARRWPPMKYLEGVATTRPAPVCGILVNLESENWWVVGDALRIATVLPPRLAGDVVSHFLPMWQRSAVQWVSRDIWPQLLSKVCRLGDGGSRVAEIMFRLSWAVLRSGRQRIDFSPIAEHALSDNFARYTGSVADGIQTAIVATAKTTRRELSSSFTLDLENLERSIRPSGKSAADILLALWVECLGKEAQLWGGSRATIRAASLAESSDELSKGMALQALNLALTQDREDTIAINTMSKLILDEELFASYFLRPEVARLIRRHWSSAPIEHRAKLEKEWISDSENPESRVRRRAQDWLLAIKPYLGAEGTMALNQLEQEFGEGELIPQIPEPTAMWVGPQSPVKEAQLTLMTPGQIVALMRHTPGPKPGDWKGPSPEGLGRQLTPLIAQRIGEFLEVLPEIATEVQDRSILLGVIHGLEEGFKQDPEAQTPEALSSVLTFFTETVRGIDTETTTGSDFSPSASEVIGSIADWFEALPSWVAKAHPYQPVIDLLRRALSDEEPSKEHEEKYGGSNMNPPTLALNVTRGKAQRAAFALLATYWGDAEVNVGAFRASLESLIRERVKEETSPSVRSIFGLYLPQILAYWPELWDERSSFLLPKSRQDLPIWDATFTTYLLFHPVRRRTVERLFDDYVLASSLLSEGEASFLNDHATNLLTHLLVLSLSSDDELDWDGLLFRGLAAAEDEAAAGALRNLSAAVRADDIDLSTSWLRTLVQHTIPRLREAGDRRNESTALLELMMSSKYPLHEGGGFLLDLAIIGASPDVEDVLEYLGTADETRTSLGAQLLRSIVTQDSGEEMRYVDDTLRSAIRDYAVASPEEMRIVVDQLGRSEFFDIEPEARFVYETLQSEAP